MDKREHIRSAVEVLNELEIPQDLRVTAFSFLLDQVSTRPSVDRPPTRGSDVGSRSEMSEDTILAQRAKALGVDLQALDELFVTGADGEIELTVSNRAVVSGGIKSGLEKVVLLLAFIRQGQQIEESTSQERFAAVADQYGVRDSNFSRHLRSFSEQFQVHGASGSRSYKLKRAGWERAAEIIAQLSEGV